MKAGEQGEPIAVPLNFIGINEKKTKEYYRNRMISFWWVFDKRDGHPGNKDPFPGLTEDSMETRMKALHTIIWTMAKPRIRNHIVNELNKMFELRMVSFDDLLVMVRDTSASSAIDLKKKLAIIHYCHFGLWGHHNERVLALELDMLSFLGWKYSGRMVNHHVPKKNHRGAFIKDIIVKCKNSLMELVKNAMIATHSVWLYPREPPHMRDGRRNDSPRNGQPLAKGEFTTEFGKRAFLAKFKNRQTEVTAVYTMRPPTTFIVNNDMPGLSNNQNGDGNNMAPSFWLDVNQLSPKQQQPLEAVCLFLLLKAAIVCCISGSPKFVSSSFLICLAER